MKPRSFTACFSTEDLGTTVPWTEAHGGFDDIHAASLVRSVLTKVGHSASEPGNTAAGILLERIAGAGGPPVDVELGFELKKAPVSVTRGLKIFGQPGTRKHRERNKGYRP